MKKKIKKNRLKIFIALSLMFTLITTIFIGTKTFAYTTNEFSTTLGNPTSYGSTTFINENTYETDGYIDFRVNNDSGYVTYITFDILDENIPVSFANSNYIFIMNCAYLTQNGVIENTSTGQSIYICQSVSSYSIYNKSVYLRNYITKNNKSYKCVVQGLDQNTNFSTTSGKITFGYRGGQWQSSDTNWQGIRIYNIDILSSDELYTSNYIEDIESQYNELLEDYEQLEDDYYQLNNDYTDLEQDYNELEENYNNVEQNYNNLNEVYTLGAFAFMREIDLYFNYSETEDVILNSQQSKALLTNSTLDIYNNIYKQYDEAIEMYIYFNNLNIQYINFSFVSPTTNELIELYLTNGTNNVVISKSQQDINITYDWLLEQNEQLNDNYNLVSIRLKDIYTGDIYNYQYLKSNSPYQLAYTNGLNTGWNNGYNVATLQAKSEIEELQNQLNTSDTIRIEQYYQLHALREQLEAMSSDYNLNNLMWTIASTPFESFKQIWDVKFFGVNVSELVLGLITTFIALNIAKRFFF